MVFHDIMIKNENKLQQKIAPEAKVLVIGVRSHVLTSSASAKGLFSSSPIFPTVPAPTTYHCLYAKTVLITPTFAPRPSVFKKQFSWRIEAEEEGF